MARTKSDRPESLVSYLEKRIESSIAQGEHPPRSRLSPTVLADKYDVSHIPVREALSSLAAKGYVDYRQSRGYFTRDLSSEELSDIYHWRTILETEALQLAFPLITDDDLAKMRRIVEEEEDLTGANDRIEYLELNRQFHFIAFARAGSPVLLHLLNYLWDISRPYLSTEMIESSRSHTDHIRQIEIYESGTIEELLAAMKDHRVFRMDLVKQWEKKLHDPAGSTAQ